MKATFARDYGIVLVSDGEVYPLKGSDLELQAKNAGANNVDMVLYLLRREFAKYPPDLVRRSGIQRIVLCRELKAGTQRIAGVAVKNNASIYVDSTTLVGDEAHRRRTLHHEFFHFLDYAQHPEISHNPEWEAANAPEFHYGQAAPAPKPGPRNWASHPAPGFVSDYSMRAVPEDRAELFCGLMTNNLTLQLMLQKDIYLAAKVRLLKEELHHFCPELDESFWSGIAGSWHH